MLRDLWDTIMRVFTGGSEHFPGVLPDVRSEVEKLKDYLHKEVTLPGAIIKANWVEKAPESFKKYPIRYQDGSYSCVAQGTAKMLGIEKAKNGKPFEVLSALDIYDRRINKNEADNSGMIPNNALDIAKKFGACTEEQLPSQNLPESKMNAPVMRTTEMIETAEKNRTLGYVKLDKINIDTIADIIEKGHPVGLCFLFSYIEWTDVPTLTQIKPNISHFVVAVDYTIYKGEKALVVEDSWGNFSKIKGQRIITESFLNRRCTYAGYILDLIINNEAFSAKPRYIFNTAMNFGDENTDVRHLQEILRYEGLFPNNIPLTGYYGAITAKAVLQFQLKYNIDNERFLKILGGRKCGPKTLEQLNKVYSY